MNTLTDSEEVTWLAAATPRKASRTQCILEGIPSYGEVSSLETTEVFLRYGIFYTQWRSRDILDWTGVQTNSANPTVTWLYLHV